MQKPSIHHQRQYTSTSPTFVDTVKIGDIEIHRGPWPTEFPHRIVQGYLNNDYILPTHLRWMMQKDLLQQDMCLVGSSETSELCRNYTMAYGEMTRRPVSVVTITSDTTESDLKQRRELIQSSEDPTKLDLVFSNAAPVEAAINGHLLLLDGLNRASRNVLPALNNLLEHRSMNLEDGRLLVPASFIEQHPGADPNLLIPVHPDFRVLATTEATKPLDPPLRSRFAMRRIDADLSSTTTTSSSWSEVYNKDFYTSPAPHQLLTIQKWQQLFGKDEKPFAKVISSSIPQQSTEDDAWDTLAATNWIVDGVVETSSSSSSAKTKREAKVSWSQLEESGAILGSRSNTLKHIMVPCGADKVGDSTKDKSLGQARHAFHSTPEIEKILSLMIQSHAVGRDILLIAPPGEGKTTVTQEFAQLLGYGGRIHRIHADPEKTWSDLLLRRDTSPVTGETSWASSPLLEAAMHGDLCVIDHTEKLRPDVLSGLASLCNSRDVCLPDGRRLVCPEKSVDVDHDRLLIIHPSFRIVALASQPWDMAVKQPWFRSSEVCSMFTAVLFPPTNSEGMSALLHGAFPDVNEEYLKSLLALRELLTKEVATECGVRQLSTRHMMRIIRRIPSEQEEKTDSTPGLHTVALQALGGEMLPRIQRSSLERVFEKAKIHQVKQDLISKKDSKIEVLETKSFIDDFEFERLPVERPERVPAPAFFDIPNHILLIKDLLQDWTRGERAFLLLGNQGVGKNMIVDRICQVANWEREYIQLHRDSTIGQMTLQPTLEDGKIVWKDSPLVRAASQGLALVVDEADKAPTEVLAVLKSLVEDGELLLGDGRRISRHESRGQGIIPMHPDFTIWVLANRPGFPFLGNAFFQLIGDCFSSRVVSNPDFDSELSLLRNYGKHLDSKLLRSICGCFADLRSLSDRGDLAYPYSTREAVAVVKHLERFPNDSVVSAFHNVIDFDSFDSSTYLALGDVMSRHGFSIEEYATWKRVLAEESKHLSIEFSGEEGSEGISSDPPPLDSPHLGKWDEKNEAHVGGNQWAGGTGGSNTAGLGGRGGPYRLDRGHKVHQVTEEAKTQVSEEARTEARRMAEEGLKKRLAEINMSEQEWDMYRRFVDPIKDDIVRLKSVLNQVNNKNVEKGWIRRQKHGELDDAALVDGITGEKHIFKRRGTVEDYGPSQQPKELRFVVDVSGSMYR